jgi:hypothetical protein
MARAGLPPDGLREVVETRLAVDAAATVFGGRRVDFSLPNQSHNSEAKMSEERKSMVRRAVLFAVIILTLLYGLWRLATDQFSTAPDIKIRDEIPEMR